MLLIDPVTLSDFVLLMKKSWIILTDSGGVQEEAPSLVLGFSIKSKTERNEAINAGTVKLIGSKEKNISNWVSILCEDKHIYKKMSRAINPYGDGFSVNKILVL